MYVIEGYNAYQLLDEQEAWERHLAAKRMRRAARVARLIDHRMFVLVYILAGGIAGVALYVPVRAVAGELMGLVGLTAGAVIVTFVLILLGLYVHDRLLRRAGLDHFECRAGHPTSRLPAKPSSPRLSSFDRRELLKPY